jgi:hypothetical protein
VLVRARTHNAYAVGDVLAVRGHTKMFLNREALAGPHSGRNEPELAAMEMHMGQPKFAKEVPDNLGVPVIAPPGLLETNDAPRFAAGSGDFQDTWQHRIKQLDVSGDFKPCAITLAPI